MYHIYNSTDVEKAGLVLNLDINKSYVQTNNFIKR